MFLKRRFSKAASRKGKTAYKFKFTFELANLTGVPANVDHAALTFARGAKTYTSSVASVEECAAVWHDARSSRLEFVATLYKDSSGKKGRTRTVHKADCAKIWKMISRKRRLRHRWESFGARVPCTG